MATNKTETLVDENGVEIIISYEYERGTQREECHGTKYVDDGICVTLLHVEMVIAGSGIELLHLLNEKQQQTIVDHISFD